MILYNTVTISIPDLSGIQMVDFCPVFKWWSEKSLIMVQNVRYLNDPPSHMTFPFEYQTPILSGIQMNPVFRCWVFRWLLH